MPYPRIPSLTPQQAFNRGALAGERFVNTGVYPKPEPRVLTSGRLAEWQEGFNSIRFRRTT